MAENENFLHRMENAAENRVKKIGFYLCIGLVSIAVIFAAGLLNLWKNMTAGQTERLQVAGEYVQAGLNGVEECGAEEILQAVSGGISMNGLADREIDYYYVYDSETDDVIGNGDVSRIEKLQGISERRLLKTKGWLYCELDTGGGYTVILESSTETVSERFRQMLPKLFWILAVVTVVYCLLIWIFMADVKEEKKRDRGMSVVLFIMLAVLTAGDAVTTVLDQFVQQIREVEVLYADVELYVEQIEALDDTQIEQLADSADADSGRIILMDREMEILSSEAYTASYDPDIIFDDSEEIYVRATITPDVRSCWNQVFQYFLEAVMYAVLALILFWGIIYYKDYFGSEREKTDPVRRAMDRMKLLSTAKSFADALTVTVAVTILKSLLEGDCGSSADIFVNWTILAVSMIAMVGAFLLPRCVRLAGGSFRLMPVSLALCAAGSLLCFLAHDSLPYVIGYLIIAVGDTMFGLMFLMIPCEVVPAEQHPMREVSKINMSQYGGQIIGYVAGGTLAVLLPYRWMFLIAFGLLMLTIIPAVKIAGIKEHVPLPGEQIFFRAMFSRRYLKFLFLVQAPYAMVGYYFKYVVPLNVQAMNTTVTLVSFLLFFRMVMRLEFKRVDKVKNFWKKFSPRTAVLLCMVTTAILFLAMCNFGGILAMVICTMLIALIESRFSGIIEGLGFDVMNDDPNLFFTGSAAQTISRKYGKSLAAAITQALGTIGIPFWIAGSALLYLLLTIRDGKKPRTPER